MNEKGRITLLVDDIQKCPVNKKYKAFFVPFCNALLRIEDQKQTLDSFSLSCKGFSEEQWSTAREALESFKKQWFAKKLYEAHIDRKLQSAKANFEACYTSLKIEPGTYSKWEFDTHKHLMKDQAYVPKNEESHEDAEKRIQQLSPFGSEVFNRCRSELFISSLALNEAILEKASLQFQKHWGDLRILMMSITHSHRSRSVILIHADHFFLSLCDDIEL